MKKFWGILGAIFLFGSIELANSTTIGANDYNENWFFETVKVNEYTSNAAPRRSNIKQKHVKKKAQRRNATSLAVANVVTNGGFTNGLSTWAINNPGNFPYGITVVDIDGPGLLRASDAFFVKAGTGFATSNFRISQRITIPVSGAYSLFANIASSYFPADNSINNLSGGIITVALNGREIDSFDFGEIARSTWRYATLNASFVAVSSGILDINFLRPYAVDINSPTNYLDNVFLALNNGAETPVPEPATMLLLGSGLIGLVAYGRKKFIK